MLFANIVGDVVFIGLFLIVILVVWLIYILVAFVFSLFKTKDQKQKEALESLKLHRNYLFEERRKKTRELKEINDEIAVIELRIEETEYSKESRYFS